MKKIPLNWIYRTAAVLLVLVLATTVMCSGMFARFVSFATGSDSARVAKFDFKVSEILYRSDVQYEEGVVTKYTEEDVTSFYAGSGGHNFYVDPGYYEESSHIYFEYTVENDSEVTVEVTFSARTTGNLNYRAYFINQMSAEKANGVEYPNVYKVNNGVGGEKTVTIAPGGERTVYLWMDMANVKTSHTWDDLYKYNYSYEIDQLTVTIDCRQVD